jgi:hypothetical protein
LKADGEEMPQKDGQDRHAFQSNHHMDRGARYQDLRLGYRARSPWQNRDAKRAIGSIRRECLDHTIVFGEAHSRRILKTYADY